MPIHINNAKTGFRVQYTGRNGEILTTSEVLKSKQSAYKNIAAMYGNMPQVDESPLVYVVEANGTKYLFNCDTKTKVPA